MHFTRQTVVKTLRVVLTASLSLLVAGCAVIDIGTSNTEFALSSPENLPDFRKLENDLTVAGIHCTHGFSSMGTISLVVYSRDFARAKEKAIDLVVSNSLTVRVRSNPNSWNYEVWQHGIMIRQESYVIEKPL